MSHNEWGGATGSRGAALELPYSYPARNSISNFIVYNDSVIDIHSVLAFTVSGSGLGTNYGALFFKAALPDIWYSFSLDIGSSSKVHASLLTGSTNIPFASFDLVYGFSVIADFTLMSRAYVPAQFSTPTHLIGVTRDNSLMEKSSFVNQWAPIPGLRILDLVQLPDLSFVAVGMDKTLYACPSLETCTQIPGSGYVKSIDVLPDKTTYIGVGMDNKLYTRAGMFASWNLIRNSGNVVDVTVLTNGVILGTTPERTLVYREKVDLKWKEVKNSCCVLRTAALLNGSFVGIGDDYVLYRRANLDAVWDYIPGTGSVVSVVQISAMPVPKIILVGIKMDNTFWGKYSLAGPWSQIAKTKALDFIQLPDGTFITAGMDNLLYKCQTLASCTQVPGSVSVISIDILSDKRTFVGVGIDGLLYTRDGISAGWKQVWNSGKVIDITVLNSGALLGTGPDKYLYLKSTLKSDWTKVQGSCCVTRTAQLPDGSILGIGTDNAIYQKQTLLYTSPWYLVPNSKAVRSIGTTH